MSCSAEYSTKQIDLSPPVGHSTLFVVESFLITGSSSSRGPECRPGSCTLDYLTYVALVYSSLYIIPLTVLGTVCVLLAANQSGFPNVSYLAKVL